MTLRSTSQNNTEIRIGSTLPIGCSCCPAWRQYGTCELFLDIATDTTSIATGLRQPGHHCQYSISPQIVWETIPITATQRMGTSRGMFDIAFEPLSNIFESDPNNPVNIWQGYTPPSISVCVCLLYISL